MINIILPKPLFTFIMNSLVYFCRNETRPRNLTDQINTGLNLKRNRMVALELEALSERGTGLRRWERLVSVSALVLAGCRVLGISVCLLPTCRNGGCSVSLTGWLWRLSKMLYANYSALGKSESAGRARARGTPPNPAWASAHRNHETTKVGCFQPLHFAMLC